MNPRTFVSRLSYARLSVHTSLSFRSIPIEDPSDTIKDGFLLWMLAVKDIIRLEEVDSALIQLYYKLMSADVYQLGTFLKDVSLALRKEHSLEQILTAFKGQELGSNLCSGHLLMLLKKFLFPLSAVDLKSVLTIFEFPSRINIVLPIDDILIADYVDYEEQLSRLEIPVFIQESLRDVITTWFPQPVTLEKVPRHGPGSIAGKLGKIGSIRKNSLLGRDLRLDYANIPVLPFEIEKGGIERVSELVFVPKSLTTYRTICKEPATLQFWQQCVASEFIAAFPSDLRRHIDLSDQTKSRELARTGSITKKFDTIDLSNASDSVHFGLIKQIFRNTGWLRYFLATRADRVKLPNGNIIPLHKFAPMGSALCFPVECVVFAAICEKGYSMAGIPKKRRNYRVYGDDIICHPKATPFILGILSAVGFSPNTRKSFLGAGLFRESCGGEYYGGEDVTPCRLSRRFKNLPSLTESIGACKDMLNTFFNYDLRLLRKFVLEECLLKPCRKVLFTFPDGPGIFSTMPTNFHLSRKWKKSTQSEMLTVLVEITKPFSRTERLLPKTLPVEAAFDSLLNLEHRVIREDGANLVPDIFISGYGCKTRTKLIHHALPVWAVSQYVI